MKDDTAPLTEDERAWLDWAEHHWFVSSLISSKTVEIARVSLT